MAKPKEKTGLAARIAAAREHAGLSQTALGKAIGLTRSSVSQWEGDGTEPTPENLRSIAIFCRVDYSWLATGEGRMIIEKDSPYLVELIEMLKEAGPGFQELLYAALKSRKGAAPQESDLVLLDQQPSRPK